MIYKITIHALLCTILIGCSGTTGYDRKESILTRIATYYTEHEEYNMNAIDSLFEVDKHGIPTRIEIHQERDYRDYYQFSIILSSSNISNMRILPTKIVKIKNRYAFMYMHEKPPLSRKTLPIELFNNKGCEFLDETSWQILMCKKCLNCIVVIDRNPMPIEYIKQFNEFTCDCSHDYETDIQEIVAEEAIIDAPDGIIPPPPMFELPCNQR